MVKRINRVMFILNDFCIIYWGKQTIVYYKIVYVNDLPHTNLKIITHVITLYYEI